MKTNIPAKLASSLRWKRSGLVSKTRRLTLVSLLAASVSSVSADSHTISVGLTDYLTYGISPYQGPRAYGIEAGGVSNIISAGLVYRGDYVPGEWGYWTYNEYGTTARHNPVQTGIMGGLAASLRSPGAAFSGGGMNGLVVGPGGNPTRIKYLGVPPSLMQSGLATLWVVHAWADPSPWAGTTPPGGPGWGGYTWEPRFWGYSSALILEYASLPSPRVRGAGNGDFQTGELDGWSSFAPDTGSVQVVTFPPGSTNFAAQLTTRRVAMLTQLTLEGVDLGFLEFDYLFLTNNGRLEISLGGSLLGVLQAPNPATNTMQSARLPVPGVLNHAHEPLVFELTGDAGEQVLLDNVGWLSPLRILEFGSPQTVNNQQVLPLEIQCLTNEFCYIQVAPAVTGPWQALVRPLPVVADRTSVSVPIMESWPQAYYRLGLWQELKLLSAPQNATAFAGVGDGSLKVMADGTGPFTYQWQRGGADLPGQTEATLHLLSPQAADTGDYTVVLTDAAGISVTSAPPATLTVEPFAPPVAWWPGDQHAFDLTGTNHGTLQGGLGYTNGEVLAAFNCVGNSYLLVPDAPELNFGENQDFTVTAWINPQQYTSGTWNVIVCKGDGPASQNGWYLSLYPDSHAVAMTFCKSNQNSLSITATSAPPINVWTHVAVQRGGGLARIYVNGRLETETSAPTDSLSNTFPLLIGQMYDWRNTPPIQPSNTAKSRVDEVALFNRALSAAEIRALHSAGSAGLYRDLRIIHQPRPATAYVGLSNAPMTVLAVGAGPLSYQWRRDEVELAGQTTASLVLPNPRLSDSGNYNVVVTDGLGVALTSSPPATLEVKLCEPPASGLIGWWPGDGHSDDLSANENQGALQGGAGYASGTVLQAFDLDGANDFVLVPDAPSLNVPGAITVEAWIKPRALGGNWLSKYNSQINQRSWAFGMYPDGRVEFFVAGTGAWGVQRAVRTTTSLSTGAVHHVAATFHPATQEMAIYINGSAVPTQIADYSQPVPAIFPSAAPVMIGGDVEADGSMSLFNGLIDEAAIYSRALSAPEIAALHAAGKVGRCKDLRIVTPPRDSVAYVGVSNAPLTVVASGVAPFRFQWSKDGTHVPGQTKSALLLPNPQVSDSGNYLLRVSDASGLAVTSAVAALVVKLCEDTVAAPFAWWPGDDHAGDLITTNHGVAQGALGYTPGKVGAAFNFSGTNTWVEVPHNADFNLVSGQACSIVAWIKPMASNFMVIVHKGNGLGSAPNGRQYWQLQARFDLPGAPLQFVMGDTAVRSDNFGSISGLRTGVWQHVAVVVENPGGPAEGYRLYINGMNAGRNVDTDMEVASINSTEPLRIGAGKNRQDEIQGYFTGQIDELMFFNHSLTAPEIARLHAAGSAGMCPPGTAGTP